MSPRPLVITAALAVACAEPPPPPPRRTQALEVSARTTVTDFAAGTFEGGAELLGGRLVVSSPSSGFGAPVSSALLDVPRAGHTAAFVRGFVYVLGGEGAASTRPGRSRARPTEAASASTPSRC
ncbi:MAG: hypothetical protein SFW67_18000 [Myxococcaceae bacterium]|nr:hypothetical protein [Myxococcaceae bacterium]